MADIPCQVTAGKVWSNETITDAKLNLAANPVVVLPDTSIPALKAELGDSLANANRFTNGAFAEPLWAEPDSSFPCAASAKVQVVDGWWILAGGAAVTAERSTNAPAGVVAAASSLRIEGATSATTVDVFQELPPYLAAAIAGPVAVTFYIYNGTGAQITPTVRVDTCDAHGDFSAVTNRAAEDATDAPNAQWTACEALLDLTLATNMSRGARVAIRVPSGALDDPSKYVLLAVAKLEIGTVPTAYRPEREDELSAELRAPNLLDNGQLRSWTSLSGPALAALKTIGPRSVWARAAGAAVAHERVEDGPDSASLWAWKLVGATSVTTVDVGQALDAAHAAECRRRLTFSAWIYNDTGAEMTPSLRVDSYDAMDDPDAVTNRLALTLQPCPNEAWTRVVGLVDGSALSDLEHGCDIYLRAPSGSMDGNSKSITVAQLRLERGSRATSPEPEPAQQDPGADTTTAARLLAHTLYI